MSLVNKLFESYLHFTFKIDMSAVEVCGCHVFSDVCALYSVQIRERTFVFSVSTGDPFFFLLFFNFLFTKNSCYISVVLEDFQPRAISCKINLEYFYRC